MNITIKINTDNDAFQGGGYYLNTEVDRILAVLGNGNNDFTFPRRCNIWDINGNVCGSIEITEE